MTTESAAKRNTQKLQRSIVDGLEDVKAQDIQVFDTEHLSSLFERVIVASGSSNRQTKALAANVRDKVREAGFPKPRIEGEANGEWIIVDCGAAVVHIMQPTFRSYYHLEELWGEKPVRLKFGASKRVAEVIAAAKPTTARKVVANKSGGGRTAARATGAAKPAAARATGPAKPAAARATGATKPAPARAAARPSSAKARTGTAAPAAAKPAVAKPISAKAPAATAAKIRTLVVSGPAGKAKGAAKRGAAPAKKATARKPSQRKA